MSAQNVPAELATDATVPPREVADFRVLEMALKAFAGPGGENMSASVDGTGRLVILTPGGEHLVFAGTEALAQLLGLRLAQFVDELRMQQLDISRLLKAYERRLVDTQEWSREQFQVDRLLSDLIPRDGSLTLPNVARSGHQDGHLNTSYDSGRIGRAIGHLPPQPGEDFLFQGDDRRIFAGGLVYSGTEGSDVSNSLYPDDVLQMPGTGWALNHLQPQPDDPSRFSQTVRNSDDTTTRGPAPAEQTPIPSRPVAETDNFTMREDGVLVGNLFENDNVPGTIRDVRIVGNAPIGNLQINGDGTFSYVPPLHFSGLVTFVYSFTDVASGNTVEAAASIVIAPVTDPALLTVPAGVIVTNEDVPVLIGGLGGALADIDGSEILSLQITGVPAGATFSGAGRDLGGGRWEFSPSEIALGLIFSPPPDLHGRFDLVLEGTTRETATGETVTTAKSFSIEITAVADVPAIAGGIVTGNEDSPMTVGGGISFAATDTDGSETISAVTIGPLPTGWTASFANIGTAIVTADGTGSYVISGQSTADVRAALDAFALVPPPNADTDIVVAVTVTSRDANGSTAINRTNLTVVVNPVSDAPVLSATALSLNEDASAVFGNLITWTRPDNDGSERISRVELGGLPTGAGSAVTWVVSGSAGVVADGSGGYVITGPNEADIRATLDTFAVRQATNADADFVITARAQTIDGTAAASALGSTTLAVTVTAVADAPSVSIGAVSGSEDTSITFGAAVTPALADTDGSEWLSSYEISAFPAGWVVAFSANAAVTVSGSANGPYTLSIAARADEAALKAVLDSFSVTPPANSDADAAITVRAQSTDHDGATAWSATQALTVVVNPVSDAPVLSATALSLNEDASAVFGNLITWTRPDNDGSERISRVELGGLPTGAGSAVTWVVSGSAGVVADGSGGYVITGPNEADIRATLDTFAVRQATNADADFVITARAQTIDGTAAASALGSTTLAVTVTAVADAPSVSIGAVSGSEDTSITFGAAVTPALADTDGSEWLSSYEISAFPAGWVVAFSANAAVTVSGSANGPYTLSIAARADEAALKAVLDSFSVTPPANSDADAAITVRAQSTDHDGATAWSATQALTVVVNPVSDAPVLSATALSLNEDASAVFGNLITWTRPDNDGSERISRVELGGLPTGAGSAVTWVVSGSAGVVADGSGGYVITGPNEADIRATLDTFAVRQATNADADFVITARAQTIDGTAAASALGSTTLAVTVTAVADAPSVSIGAVSGSEDTSITFGAAVTPALADTDGSEWLSSYEISAFPAGWVVAFSANAAVTVSGSANGPYTLSIAARADEAALKAVLDSFSVTPPANSDADAAITVRAQSTDHDGATAWSATQALTVVVNPVSDAPVLSATALSLNEDASAVFGNLITWTRPDNDGSERISRVELGGLPTGAGSAVTWVVSGSAGVVADGSGGYVITGPNEADIRATLDTFAVRQATNADADFVITARAQTIDGTAAASALGSTTLAVTVTAVADAPSVSIGAVSGSEDTSITFGAAVTPALADTDGSEWLSSYEISAFPAGWVVAFSANAAVTVSGSANGPYTLSIAARADEAALKAVLDSFSVTPPANSDADAAITVRAQSTDHDGATAWSATQALTVVVNPVSDAPVLSATALSLNEDASAVFGNLITWTRPDNDGSERISRVELGGLPTGAGSAVTWVVSGSAGVVADGSGGYVITGPNEADIRATLDTFAVRQATNADADFVITARAQTIDGTAAASALGSTTLAVTVTAVADAPSVSIGAVSGSEDTSITFGAAVTPALADTDGSEWLSSYEISAFPAGWVVAFSANAAVTVSGSANGPYTLSIAARADEAALKAVLDSFSVTPPANSDADAAITVRAQSTDHDGATAWSATQALTVVVNPVSDAPVLSATALSLNEDASAVFGNLITWTRPDNDGSERISRVELGGLPTGAGSAVTWVVSGSAGVVADGSGGYVITGPNEADIRATLDTFAVRQATNADADFVITARAQTIDGTAAASALGSTTLAVTVTAVADAPSVSIGAVSGSEDTSITFGPQLTFVKPDNDGSERINQVELSGLPTAAGSNVSWTVSGGASVVNLGGGVYTITGPTEAGIRATLDSFAVQQATNSDADITVQARATTTDADGSTAQGAYASLNVVVRAVADMPSGTATGAFGSEDTNIPVTLTSAVSGDADGSETLSVRITGVPTGATFSAGASGGAGIWVVTPAQLSGLTFRPPPQANGTYNMVLEVTSTEVATGLQVATATATASSPFSIMVSPVLDPPNLSASSQTINEDVTINVGAQFNIGLIDLDGSQSFSYTIAGIPAGYTYNRTLNGATTINTSTPGQIIFSGPNANDVINSIRTLTFSVTALGPRVHADSNFTLNLSATTVETGGASSTETSTHAVTVQAVADAPTNSAPTALVVNEDPALPISFPITVNRVDTDGSERLLRVDVTTQTAAHRPTITWDTLLPGSVVGITNGFRFSGTASQIQNLLASVKLTPILHNGTDFVIRVASTSEENNPTEAGGVATLTATATTNYTINMVPVADTPTVSAPGTPYAVAEDLRVKMTGSGVSPSALTGALVDSDTSETLSFQITNVPTGASFHTAITGGAAVGSQAGSTWTFTAAQFTAGVFFQPPPNLAGTINMNVVSVATETEVVANRIATNTAPFSVTVTAVADLLTLSGTSTGNEDSAINFGANVGIALIDADGSEYISSVTLSGFPSGALVSFTGNPNVTVTGTGLGPYTLSIASSVHATQLRNVLNSFSVTPPAQSDANITVNVSATTTETGGLTQVTNGTHAITVRAVADTPVANGNDVAGTEDTAIALNLSTGASADADGSETLSARILDVPAGSVLTANTAGGGTFVSSGGGIWTITAPSTTQLNTILGSVQYTPPTHISGPITMRLEVTATEGATGGELFGSPAVTIDPFTVTVTAVADMPTLRLADATGGAAGREDTAIPLSISTTLIDTDGSEVLSLRVSGVPAGSSFVNGVGTAIGANLGGGIWSFTQAQLADIRIRPPLHSNDDFTLTVTLRATESTAGVPGLGDFREVSGPLQVQVIGVADTPTLNVATVNGTEDQVIPLGTAITGALSDLDGSETLYYVLSGLPAGVLPSVGTFIGGEWQISAAQLASLTIPAPLNFSGNYTSTYAPNLKIRAVAQEDDGDQAVAERALNVVVAPVLDAFGGWSASVTVNEGSDIPLASAAFSGLPDNDGSEQIASYTFDLNGLIAAAQISGTTANVASFISTHVSGTFTNNGNGTITVLAANLAGVSLRSQAFLDSNIDFSIPVTALVTEASGLTQMVAGTYAVNLVGVADVPTAFASDVSSITGTPTAMPLGGAITDTDVSLGRTSSERIYYIVSGPGNTLGTDVAFLTSSNEIAGLNNNDGTWYLTPADLAGLKITSRYGFVGDVVLTLTSISVENDGSLATNATPTTFTASFTPDSGGSGGNIVPLTPTVSITPMTASEDGNVIFTVTVTPAPGDPSPTPPSVSLFISNLPPGTVITGATLNPNTNRYIATADDLTSGAVRIIPPANFSGTLPLTIEAVAMNAQLNTATTGPRIVNVTVTPDADGPAIQASPAAGLEDTATALNLSVSLTDTDAASPEVLNGPIRITVSDGAVLSAGTLVSPGVYDLTPAQLAGLTITPAANWHGDVAVSVSATSREPGNGDTQTTVSSFTVAVRAVADVPNATASNVSGTEDGTIALSGLSAALTDTVTTNGGERLSVKIVGIPEGSILSAGANNGDGSWTIPVSSLASLTLKPPKDYSGLMNLSLQAFALDADGSTATRNVPFTVTVTPVADTPTIAPQAVTGMENSPVQLNLGLKMSDTNGIQAGENPAELIELTFSGLVTGTSLTSIGGTLAQLSGTSWRFTGTSAQAGTLAYIPNNDSGLDTINVSAVSIDGASRSSAVADMFTVTTTAEADAPLLLATSASGAAGSTFAVNLQASLFDTDGSETLSSITVTGVPATVTFSAGVNAGGGNWTFTSAQLAGLNITLPGGQTSFSMGVSVTATESINGDFETTTGTLAITVGTGGSNIIGDSQSNNLRGGANADTLSGGAGNDTLDGGNGNDTLIGGAGIDILTGGAGADRLVWQAGDPATGPDQVIGFNVGQNDRLDLSDVLNYTSGPLSSFVQFVDGGGNTTVNIDANGGGSFTTSLAVLQGVTGLNVETLRTSGHLIG